MSRIHKLFIIMGCMALALAVIGPFPATARAAADRGAGVSAAQLPEEVRSLTVENRFIPGEGVPIGKVRKIRGHLIVRHGNAAEAYFAAPGDSLYAHDELFTLKRTRVRIRFTTADIVNMGANSRIRVDELVDDRRNRQKKTKMSMLRGKAMFYVMRLMKYNKVDTQVRTPTAVCGVRGTKFAIVVRKKDDLWSGLPLYLADASGMSPGLLIADNGGGDTVTDMHMLEGDGFMAAGGTTVNLGSGQSGTAGDTGPPSTSPTPPGMGLGLNNDTNPDADGDDGDGDGDDGGDTGDNPNAAGDLGDSGTDTTNTVGQAGLAAVPTGPEKRIGYFAAMLTRFEPMTYPDNVFVSEGLQDHEGPDIVGTDVTGYTGDKLKAAGAPGTEPTLTEVDTCCGGPIVDLGPQHQIEATQVGINAYLTWGYWIMTTPMHDSGGTSYVIDNAGVYVHGDPTPVENLHGITGHYVGTSWGTYWDNAGGVQLAGTMSADVALGSTVLKNFNLSASGGGHTVTIQQTADTYFSGPNGEFKLRADSNATFKIDGNNAMYSGGAVTGGLFGPNGEAIAGAGGLQYGSQKAVVGFEGTKQ